MHTRKDRAVTAPDGLGGKAIPQTNVHIHSSHGMNDDVPLPFAVRIGQADPQLHRGNYRGIQGKSQEERRR